MEKNIRGHLKIVTVKTQEGIVTFKAKKTPLPVLEFNGPLDFLNRLRNEVVIDYDDGLLEIFGSEVALGTRVVVSEYKLRGVQHFYVRPEGRDQTVYDKERLPQYLFFGAALMTVGILVLLRLKLPDFFVRTLFWLKSLGKYQLKAVGMQHLPATGPVLLATNCDSLESSLQLVSVTDRFTTVILIDPAVGEGAPLLERMAARRNLVVVSGACEGSSWQAARTRALALLERGDMVALGINGQELSGEEGVVRELSCQSSAPVVPVYCGPLDGADRAKRVRVVFGAAADPATTLEELRQQIHQLAEWIKHNDDKAALADH
jgi:hypothetical protein